MEKTKPIKNFDPPRKCLVIQTRSVGNETTAWEEAAEAPEPGDAGHAVAAALAAVAVGGVEDGRKHPAWEAGQTTSDPGIEAVVVHIEVEVGTAEGEEADMVVDIVVGVEAEVGIALGTGPAAGAATELEGGAAVAIVEAPYCIQKAVGG